ncbi:MAG: DNA polymerase IV [Clostridia bacterium]|nr:DNA polymerase IV [Clostridia bacterium]
MQRTIMHVDMNGCYASIECLHNPAIRDKPVAVGGDVEARHGIILAKNEHAKKYGIKTGEALWQAKQKCPELVIVQPHFDRYIRFSRLAREIYADYSNQVEPFGLDEAWVDVTGSPRLDGTGEALAHEIRERIKFELGVTVSVGVSWNKVFAKLGSDYQKPDAVTVFTKEDYKGKIWPLPAEDLLYVGRATRKKLLMRGIHTIGEIARTDPALLQGWFGKWGLILSAFANGEDTSPVANIGDEAVVKSIGNSTTTPRDLENDEDAKIVYFMLCESVAERMREAGFLARTVQISLRDKDLNFLGDRQMKLQTPSCLASEIHAAAMTLLRNNYDWHKPLRSIAVKATDLLPATTPLQLTMFEDTEKRERMEMLERTIDDIRRRFGHYAIYRAAVIKDSTLTNINPKDDHTIHPVGYFKAV